MFLSHHHHLRSNIYAIHPFVLFLLLLMLTHHI
jgi:hypothetical protein